MFRSIAVVAVGIALILAFFPSEAAAQSASASIQVNVTQPQPVAAGANFDYVVNVSSEGPDHAMNMVMTFPLPAGISFQSEVVPAGWSCNAIAPGTMAPTVTCTNPDFAPGGSVFTITASTAPNATPGTYSSTATVTSTTPDPSDNDNTAQVDVTISIQSNYGMALAAAPNPVNAGSNLTWTMTVTNNGPSNGSTATAALPLPAPTTFVSVSAPPGWSCSTPSVGSNGTVSCSLTSTLNVSATATFTVVSNVPSSVASGTTLSATATVSSPDDGFPINDSATASVQSAVTFDLGVTKTRTPAIASPGSSQQYTIVVTNNGPSDATGVTMTDVLPVPLRFTSLVSPGGWSCTTPAPGANGTITCTIPSLAAGTVATFTLNVVIDPATAAGTAINNTATVASALDSNNANNSATSSVVVVTPPNVTATKSAGGSHAEGGVVIYTIVETNSGTLAQADNPGNELTDVLPSSLTLLSANATSGTAVANVGTNTVTWNGAIAGSGSVTITIQALIKNGTIGATISNQATVSYDADANGTNESSRQSDDPSTAAASDPTSFIVAGSIPALSHTMLLLLGALIAAIALMTTKP
jgi:uncharacterized repeat protein (TIGR01451 family)